MIYTTLVVDYIYIYIYIIIIGIIVEGIMIESLRRKTCDNITVVVIGL